MAVVFVQHSPAGTGTTSPITVTMNAASVGHLLVAFIASNRGTSAARTVSSITLTNCTFGKLGSVTNASGSVGLEIWAGFVTGGSSGTSASIAFSGTVASGAVAVIGEYTGVFSITADATAVTNTGTGGASSTTATTAAYSVPSDHDLVLCAMATTSGAFPVASGFDNSYARVTTSSVQLLADTLGAVVATTAGTQPVATWTLATGSLVWQTLMVALKAIPSVAKVNSSLQAVTRSSIF